MSFGPPELILILVIVLIIFGAGKLPQVFGSLGKGVKEFREASEDKPETPNIPPPAPTISTPTAMPPVIPTNTSPEEQAKR
jgi:sec-independent protein translocase protein TatA